MNISAILVVVPVHSLAATIEALEALPGVEVHHTDRLRSFLRGLGVGRTGEGTEQSGE